jgi:hypothetical protein
MPLKQHPTDPDKMIYASRHYDIPQLQGVTTTQRPWVGLTDEERDAITSKVIGFNSCVGWEEDYAKAIEAKLKEKNT